MLSDDQFERLKRELEDDYQGARNAGRPLLLEGGLDWKAMSLSPKDMDFLEAKHTAAREIALAFGVPPMLLGIPGDNTYSNYQEANRVFFRATVLPLANRIGGALAHWLGARVRRRCGSSSTPTRSMRSRADRAALWSRISDAPFLTLNEKRARGRLRAARGRGPACDDAREMHRPDPHASPSAATSRISRCSCGRDRRSALLLLALRELRAATRRFDDFVRELARFNERHDTRTGGRR